MCPWINSHPTVSVLDWRRYFFRSGSLEASPVRSNGLCYVVHLAISLTDDAHKIFPEVLTGIIYVFI
jgi:hypothetical protein